MFFEGGGYKSRAGCHGARTVCETIMFRMCAMVIMLFIKSQLIVKFKKTTSVHCGNEITNAFADNAFSVTFFTVPLSNLVFFIVTVDPKLEMKEDFFLLQLCSENI